MEFELPFLRNDDAMIALPPDAQQLLEKLKAPARLVAHLEIVHAVAHELTESLLTQWPQLSFDRKAVLFGATAHDIGKVLHPEEIVGPGNQHEVDGPALLEKHGISPARARFAKTHGERHSGLALEDLLVALADTIWKGQRDEHLESSVTARIADELGIERCEVFSALDAIVEKIASSGAGRLAMQRQADG